MALVAMPILERSNIMIVPTCHQRVSLRSPKLMKLHSKLRANLTLKKRQSLRIPLLLKLMTRLISTLRKAWRSHLPLMLLQLKKIALM